MTSRRSWKAFETRIAKLFNTKRTPLSSGASRHTRSDTLHDNLFIEIKKHDNPLLLQQYREEFEDIQEMAREEGKVPILIHGEKYQKDEDAKCVIKLSDLLELMD